MAAASAAWPLLLLLLRLLLLLPLLAPAHALAVQAPQTLLPVVLWHGMGDSCCDPRSMGAIKRIIEAALPGVFVYSVRLGADEAADQVSLFSFFLISSTGVPFYTSPPRKLHHETSLPAPLETLTAPFPLLPPSPPFSPIFFKTAGGLLRQR